MDNNVSTVNFALNNVVHYLKINHIHIFIAGRLQIIIDFSYGKLKIIYKKPKIRQLHIKTL